MHLALAHDSITQLGGAERVVSKLCKSFPDAPLYVLVANPRLKALVTHGTVRTSWLQVVYRIVPKLQYLLPLIPAAVSSLRFWGAKVVLSSSSGFIKNICLPEGAVHVCYCHTPTRFLWLEPSYLDQELPVILRPLKPLLKRYLGYLKRWDWRGAQRVTYFIANSREVQRRIREHYGRDSEVIYPPVDTGFWRPTFPKRNHFLLVGRLQAHKRADFFVRLCTELGLPLRVAGEGRQLGYLRSLAGPNVTFLGRISDEQLRDEYSQAAAVLFPQVEDLGLVPLEAAACKTPTLAYGKGGALETVVPGKTGELFFSYDVAAVGAQLKSWDASRYDGAVLRAHAEKFSDHNFDIHIRAFLVRRNLMPQA